MAKRDIRGQVVELEDRDSGSLRTAHVSQLARFRAADPSSVRAPVALEGSSPQDEDKVWKKVDKGTKIVFHIKGDPASHLRVGEVLEYDRDEGKLSVWFYIHGKGERYDPELPLALWHATPEWYDSSNKAVVFPKQAAKERLFMRDGDFTVSGISLIAAGISLQRGKLPESVINLADAWLLRASKKDRRALRALSKPQG